MEANSEWKKARSYAFRLLSMRTYHSSVLLQKMERKGFARDVCEKIIEECKRLGFLKDDEAILRELRRGYGPRYIEFKLRLGREEVRRVITRAMQRERIGEMLPKLGEREKAIRTLQRKGFDLDIAIEFFS